MKKECWAASLGDCGGGISREHLVSQSFFPEGSITVHGLHWCLGAPKTVSLASLTGHILCRTHNSRLSDLDTGIAATLRTLEASIDLYEARKRLLRRHWTIKRFRINGILLERWFLKTFINFAVVDNKWIIGEGTHPGGKPSNELVQVVFGIKKFQAKLGLHYAFFLGEEVSHRRGLKLTPKSIGSNLLAGLFSFCGYRFFINLQSEEVREDQGSQLMYHPQRHWYQTRDDRGREVRSHEIVFDW